MTKQDKTSFPYRIDLILEDDEPSLLNEKIHNYSTILKSMSTDKFMALQPSKETKLKMEFEHMIEVSRLVLITRDVARVAVTLTLLDNDKDTVEESAQFESKGGLPMGDGTFLRHTIKNEVSPNSIFNGCTVSLTVQDRVEGAVCASIMVRGAKNQLPRGIELRNKTRLSSAGAVTTSAKKSVH